MKEINGRRIPTIAKETGFIRDNLEKVMHLKGKAVIGCTFLLPKQRVIEFMIGVSVGLGLAVSAFDVAREII